jgi:hypothetical protein
VDSIEIITQPSKYDAAGNAGIVKYQNKTSVLALTEALL